MDRLAELQALMGPASVAPPPADWDRLERELGLRFPADYRAWCQTYTTVAFSEFLLVSNFVDFEEDPGCVPVRQLLTEWAEQMRVIVDMMGGVLEMVDSAGRIVVDDQPPWPLYPEPGGLLSWGHTSNGDDCMWLTDSDPQKWTVVVTDGSQWWHFDGGFVDFLHGILSRGLVCPLFPKGFPEQPGFEEAPRFPQATEGDQAEPVARGPMRPAPQWRDYYAARELRREIEMRRW